MISTRFCPVCGAANDDTQTHCFACGQLLPENAQDDGTLLRERYRLGTSLGSGGYSAVYRGWDTQAGGRAVAIKQISLRGLGAEETIEATNTYNREVAALSSLNHPQVPRLYDHFSDADHWYLVLEYIEGQTLERYLEERAARLKPFQIEEVLSIGLQLCTVLMYLHSLHPPVIFRDLKPDNIMRTPSGRLYLIDFGIARRYTPGQSRDTQALGSPGYAAPEQYGRAQTDMRTDLYGLGALLHQLLSGLDPSEMPRALPPLHLGGQAGGANLERLIRHLLEDDPQERPASAQDVARELERVRRERASVLDGKRIWQPPVPQNYSASSARGQIQFQQQVAPTKSQRHTRRWVLAAVGAGVALVGGIGAYSSYAAFNSGSQAGSSSAKNAALYTYRGHSASVRALAWSPDSQRIASASADGTVQSWGALNGSDSGLYTSTGQRGSMNTVAWSDSGYILAAGNTHTVELWNGSDFASSSRFAGFTANVEAVAWAPGIINPGLPPEYFAAASDDGTIIVQNTQDYSSAQLKHAYGFISSIAYSPDGYYLAGVSYDNMVMIWDMKTYDNIYSTYRGHTGLVSSVVWFPNGVYLASASDDQTVRIWEPLQGTTLLTYDKHAAPVNAVTVSPDGDFVACGYNDGIVQVWSSDDGSTLATYTDHTAAVNCIAWSPDGQYIASGSLDNTICVWQAPVLASS